MDQAKTALGSSASGPGRPGGRGILSQNRVRAEPGQQAHVAGQTRVKSRQPSELPAGSRARSLTESRGLFWSRPLRNGEPMRIEQLTG